MANPRPRAVVVLSGGQDSATALLIAQRTSHVAGCIHFDYGQRHGAAEGRCAAKLAASFDLPFKVVECQAFAQLGGSALVGEGSVAAPHPVIAGLPASFVPGRNLVFLTLAAAYALRSAATEVWTGVCQTDFSGYPDCRADTIAALQAAIRLGMGADVVLVAPLMFRTKADTFAAAADLGQLDLILEHTHTCYEGDHTTRHPWGYGCSRCPSCHVRAQGWADYTRREPKALPGHDRGQG